MRVAVAIDSNGKWAASGWSDQIDSQAMDVVLDSVEGSGSGDVVQRYWVEFGIDVPVTPVVAPVSVEKDV